MLFSSQTSPSSCCIVCLSSLKCCISVTPVSGRRGYLFSPLVHSDFLIICWIFPFLFMRSCSNYWQMISADFLKRFAVWIRGFAYVPFCTVFYTPQLGLTFLSQQNLIFLFLVFEQRSVRVSQQGPVGWECKYKPQTFIRNNVHNIGRMWWNDTIKFEQFNLWTSLNTSVHQYKTLFTTATWLIQIFPFLSWCAIFRKQQEAGDVSARTVLMTCNIFVA